MGEILALLLSCCALKQLLRGDDPLGLYLLSGSGAMPGTVLSGVPRAGVPPAGPVSVEGVAREDEDGWLLGRICTVSLVAVSTAPLPVCFTCGRICCAASSGWPAASFTCAIARSALFFTAAEACSRTVRFVRRVLKGSYRRRFYYYISPTPTGSPPLHLPQLTRGPVGSNGVAEGRANCAVAAPSGVVAPPRSPVGPMRCVVDLTTLPAG